MKLLPTCLFWIAIATAACAEPAAPPTAPPSAHQRAATDLVGRWRGQATETPFGPFPFEIEFAREADDAVHGRLDNGQGMYLDFRFHRDRTGWALTEEGAIPNVGVQKHTLIPAGDGPDGVRWEVPGKPGYMDVALAVDARAFKMVTRLHGKVHAVFELQRL